MVQRSCTGSLDSYSYQINLDYHVASSYRWSSLVGPLIQQSDKDDRTYLFVGATLYKYPFPSPFLKKKKGKKEIKKKKKEKKNLKFRLSYLLFTNGPTDAA